MSKLDIRERMRIVAAAGFKVEVNQAGPLLEQMLKGGDITLRRDEDESFCVLWNGQQKLVARGRGMSVFEAALNCIEDDLS